LLLVWARIYLPGSGSTIDNWPAWWTDGQNWPQDGEMDVLEGLGGQACYHFHSPAGAPGGCAAGNFTGWHTYGAKWESGSVIYYYDGKAVGTITTGITAAPMYLILNDAVSRTAGGPSRPSTMRIAYVRVWTKAP
jgi:beta-glucanase (GH16 family)